jgi:hypothetical protein
MPLAESEHVNVTVTTELFHPAAFGAGAVVAVIVGGVLSTRTVTDVVAVLPALSLAVPETT